MNALEQLERAKSDNAMLIDVWIWHDTYELTITLTMPVENKECYTLVQMVRSSLIKYLENTIYNRMIEKSFRDQIKLGFGR